MARRWRMTCNLLKHHIYQRRCYKIQVQASLKLAQVHFELCSSKSGVYVGDSVVGGEWGIHKIVGHNSRSSLIHKQLVICFLARVNGRLCWIPIYHLKCAAFPGDPPECRTAQLVCISCPRHWLINLLQVHLPACASSNSAAVALHHQCVWKPHTHTKGFNHWVYVDICRSTLSVIHADCDKRECQNCLVLGCIIIMFFVSSILCALRSVWGRVRSMCVCALFKLIFDSNS